MTEMLNRNWADELNGKTSEEAYDIFLTHYNNAVEQCVPKSNMTINNKYTKPVWMKNATLKTIKKKHHALVRFLNTKQEEDETKYKELRNQVTHKVREDRIEYESKVAAETKENINAFWKYANSHRKTRTPIPNLKLYNGTFASTDEQKAEALNRQFASVFTNEDMDHLPEPENLEVHTPLDTKLITDDGTK